MVTDAREVLTRAAPPPDAVLRYGSHPDHVADLRRPRRTPGSPPAPLLLLIHGGFWKAEYDRAHLAPMAASLSDAGYAVVVPEYRRVGQPGGGWPGTLADVALCCERLPRLLAEREGPTLDVERVVVIGHSAGGHLAVWAAARDRPGLGGAGLRGGRLRSGGLRSGDLRGVVSLAGVLNLELAARRRLDNDAVQGLLGGTPDEVPQRYAAADPIRRLPLGVPVVCVHGRADAIVPIELSASYAVAARAAGDAVELVELAGVEHFGLIDPLSTAWPYVRAAVDRVLDGAVTTTGAG